jgi:glycosyltransferase involved in cell wall biosynthesis
MKVNLYHTLAEEGRISMEVYADALSAALRVLCEDLSVRDVTVEGHLRKRFRRLPAGARLGGYFDRYVRYQFMARAAAADVCHIVDHGYGHLVFSTGPERTIVTFHDASLLKMNAGELPKSRNFWFTVLGHRLSLAGIRRAGWVIVPSISSKNDFLRFVNFPADRVSVIPYGVGEQFFCAPAGLGGCGWTSGRAARLLHVGHCGVSKNIEGILKALPRIGASLGRMPQFMKVGGRFTPSQRDLIRQLRLEKHVNHLGFVNVADLPRIYASADALLMPSLYEGFGLPPLEAMACGTVVVASNRSSLPEVIGDAGILVEPTDPGSIAEGVTRVLSDTSLWNELRARGIERARQFSWKRTARATHRVYEQVYANLE